MPSTNSRIDNAPLEDTPDAILSDAPFDLANFSPEEIDALMQALDAPQLNVIEAKPCTSLSEILELLDEEELRYTVELLVQSFCPAQSDQPDDDRPFIDDVSRAELIPLVFDALVDPGVHEDALLDMGPSMRQTYAEIMSCGRFEFDENDIESSEMKGLLDALAMMMLAYPFSHEGRFVYIIPDEVRESYSQAVRNGALVAAEEHDLLIQYMDATTNLYGVITLAELASIVEQQNPQAFSGRSVEALLLSVVEREQYWPYFEEANIIAHEIFEEEQGLGLEFAEELLAFAGNTSRYLPEKSELLQHADPTYYEDNFEVDLFAELLESFFPNDDVNVGECALFVQDCARQGMRPEVLIDTLFEGYLPRPFDNESQANLVIKQIVNVLNTTRAWACNGHSLQEAEQLAK